MKWWGSFKNKITKFISDPHSAKQFHGWATIIWFVLSFPICILLSTSLPFVVFISVYAVVVGHWSSWQASRTEVEQANADTRIKELQKRLKKVDREAPFTPDP